MSEIMSLEEAREILGEEAEGYTDDSLLALISRIEHSLRAAIRNFKVSNEIDAAPLNLA